MREAQALLRHQIPDGDLERIFDRALEALLGQLRKRKLAATDRPRENQNRAYGGPPSSLPRSRHIPAAVRRAVWARDGGRCAFVSTDGRRCAEEGFLEFHHVVPYARGGPSSVNNIELRCRAHNGYEAECHLGRWGTAGAREEPAVYAAGASAVGVGYHGAITNSFRNEFRKRLRQQPRVRQALVLPCVGSQARGRWGGNPCRLKELLGQGGYLPDSVLLETGIAFVKLLPTALES
ncbi:MAG: HNH endonuclease [Armatimonadota bacterium]